MRKCTAMPSRQILIVDRDPSAALITERGLQRLLGDEIQVVIAQSPGMAWLRCMRGEVDLLIVDPSPPDRAATALVKALHDEQLQVPVLVLTAYDTPGLRAQLRALGVEHYLAKPVDLLDLVQTVHAALGAEPRSNGHA